MISVEFFESGALCYVKLERAVGIGLLGLLYLPSCNRALLVLHYVTARLDERMRTHKCVHKRVMGIAYAMHNTTSPYPRPIR